MQGRQKREQEKERERRTGHWRKYCKLSLSRLAEI
jgi:hypothetical protein